MNKTVITILAFTIIGFTGCKENAKTEKIDQSQQSETIEEPSKQLEHPAKSVSLKLSPKSGSTAEGKVTFTELNGVVTFEARVYSLDPGMHAIHIHEKADCSSEDGKSTGGHWNPTFTSHGKWGSEEGYHKGDIGNFEADANGSGSITLQTNEWCIGCDDPNKDILGKAIIVHQGEDDFVTQPTGAAGGRVSCGGIIE